MNAFQELEKSFPSTDFSKFAMTFIKFCTYSDKAD